MEEAGPAAAERVGHLDAHDAEIEELRQQPRGEVRRLVHLADVRRDLAARELQHARLEQGFVLGQHGQRRHGMHRIKG